VLRQSCKLWGQVETAE